MTTASGGVAVIAADVARTDRRALSEAWYSTLHLAHRAASAPPSVRGAGVGSVPAGGVARSRAHGRTSVPGETTGCRPERTGGATLAAPSPADRRAAGETTRRVGRAVVALAAQPRAGRSHTIDLGAGRVRLIVQTDGRTTRVVALCSAALREPVERALAGARYALAAGGRA